MITPEQSINKSTGYSGSNMIMTGCCHATDSVPCPVCGHSIPLGESECPLCHVRIITILRKRKIST